jgi:excisionase family DNA binding protein
MRWPVRASDVSNSHRCESSCGRSSTSKPALVPRFFTIQEVAEFLGLSSRSVRRLIAEHQLPVHRFGRAVRVSENDLRLFIATRRDG